jgi:Clp amino terminal domain, pathogenicity island component
MFERYTEKARRVIFFARYEASQFGSEYIEPEHLLLGLLRDDRALFVRFLPKMAHLTVQDLQDEVSGKTIRKSKVTTSVDLPLSQGSKYVLAYAAEEADRLNHRHIGTEHLLLGLMREAKAPGAQLLRRYGAELSDLRKKIGEGLLWADDKPIYNRLAAALSRSARRAAETIEIHGSRWNLEYIHETVARCRERSWHWQKQMWKPRDIVVNRQTGAISFDLTLAADAASFEVVKNGWKKDHCAVCRWELFDSPEDAAHGVGYTNGREWLCTECYERFIQEPGFFSSSYSDVT